MKINKDGLANRIYENDDKYIKLGRGRIRADSGEYCAIGLMYNEFFGPIDYNLPTGVVLQLFISFFEPGIRRNIRNYVTDEIIYKNDYEANDIKRSILVRDKIIEFAELFSGSIMVDKE